MVRNKFPNNSDIKNICLSNITDVWLLAHNYESTEKHRPTILSDICHPKHSPIWSENSDENVIFSHLIYLFEFHQNWHQIKVICVCLRIHNYRTYADTNTRQVVTAFQDCVIASSNEMRDDNSCLHRFTELRWESVEDRQRKPCVDAFVMFPLWH